MENLWVTVSATSYALALLIFLGISLMDRVQPSECAYFLRVFSEGDGRVDTLSDSSRETAEAVVRIFFATSACETPARSRALSISLMSWYSSSRS